MLLSTGYFDWAPIYHPESFDKTLGEGGKLISRAPTPVEFITIHSLEGWILALSAFHRSLLSRWETLSDTDRTGLISVIRALPFEFKNPNRPSTAWHGTILQGVKYGLIQHAPIWAWLAHGNAANPRAPGYENEGLKWEPFDDFQCETWERMTWDAERYFGRAFRRSLGTLKEHREFGPTACPSQRPAPLYARESEEEMVSEERVRQIAQEEAEKAVKMGLAIDNRDDVRVEHFRTYLDLATNGGKGAFADAKGIPLPLIRDRDLVSRVANLEAANLERLDPGEVPDHTHEFPHALVTGGVIYETED